MRRETDGQCTENHAGGLYNMNEISGILLITHSNAPELVMQTPTVPELSDPTKKQVKQTPRWPLLILPLLFAPFSAPLCLSADLPCASCMQKVVNM
jgi:hypothetical protein